MNFYQCYDNSIDKKFGGTKIMENGRSFYNGAMLTFSGAETKTVDIPINFIGEILGISFMPDGASVGDKINVDLLGPDNVVVADLVKDVYSFGAGTPVELPLKEEMYNTQDLIETRVGQKLRFTYVNAGVAKNVFMIARFKK